MEDEKPKATKAFFRNVSLKKESEPWKVPDEVVNSFSNIDVKLLQFILSQAEKFLNEQIRSGEIITEKGHKVLALAVTIATACLVYINGDDKQVITYIAAWQGLFLSLIAGAMLLFTVKKYHTYPLGSPPSYLLVPSLTNLKTEQQEKNILFSECEQYETRIRFNEQQNRSRVYWVDAALYCLAALPLTFLVAFAFAKIVNLRLCDCG
jgi:hypothetical protein